MTGPSLTPSLKHLVRGILLVIPRSTWDYPVISMGEPTIARLQKSHKSERYRRTFIYSYTFQTIDSSNSSSFCLTIFIALLASSSNLLPRAFHIELFDEIQYSCHRYSVSWNHNIRSSKRIALLEIVGKKTTLQQAIRGSG